MEPSKAAMKAALRVLTALSDRREPDQADVDELHWYAPSERERPLDEVVCDAIQRAIKDREEKRKAAKATLRDRALVLNSADPRQEYRELCAKLKRLGNALQEATANMLAADSGNAAASSEAAKNILSPLAGEVDLNGIMQLLNEHARLTRILIPDK
jgi:hypothetical protein